MINSVSADVYPLSSKSTHRHKHSVVSTLTHTLALGESEKSRGIPGRKLHLPAASAASIVPGAAVV
jgi:hypothetical protein